ncbi:hypothetical protein AAFC00_005274 [Neodothiora populina]|uniref:ClpX, ATPase regulatory subunit n=1 Tax=Neodothiora populina TaxID=2781224 RepID=A0ABR3PKJ9_9PEZI
MPCITNAPVRSQQARLSYIGISTIVRRTFCATACVAQEGGSGRYSHTDFTSGFTGLYESGPTQGPLRDTSNIGVPRITPRVLKDHLDRFVVGQARAKKVLSVAVYNHYQRIQELQRRDDEEEELLEQQARRGLPSRHPVEDEFPGQQATVNVWPPPSTSASSGKTIGPTPLNDDSPMSIEKSNIMLLGPSGVGKTLMAKTLARVLEVPFSMSDCTPFTQAGYIGEDVDVCVQRLLAAANYDVSKAERGIICLDEIDKIATAKVSHGKDVSGEGVQQALLKIVEGTTLQIHARAERAAPARTPMLTNSPLNQQQQQPPGKTEIYNVRTDNILFICTGAFVGLHKQILDRISKGSIGFGANVRASPSSSEETGAHDTMLSGNDELFQKHLPYYLPPPPTPPPPLPSNSPQKDKTPKKTPRKPSTYNTLDLVEPQDLQKYGLIPELIGRIPISCALSALDISSLVKVLTEPRNSLVKQYEQLFALSSIELRVTSAALHAIATTASAMGTGARGLRTVMERLLSDAMFETPGSAIKYVAVTQAVATRKSPAFYFTRDGRSRFLALVAADEEDWAEKRRLEKESEGEDEEDADEESDSERRARVNSQGGAATTFEEYRQKAHAAGFT